MLGHELTFERLPGSQVCKSRLLQLFLTFGITFSFLLLVALRCARTVTRLVHDGLHLGDHDEVLAQVCQTLSPGLSTRVTAPEQGRRSGSI